MNDIKQRLLFLKGKKTVKEFAESLDLPPSTVYYYLNGREPSLTFIMRVCNKLGVSVEWLISGEGEIFKEEEGVDEVLNQIIEYLKENWNKWSKKKKHWFEVTFRQFFPDFDEWLRAQKMDQESGD